MFLGITGSGFRRYEFLDKDEGGREGAAVLSSGSMETMVQNPEFLVINKQFSPRV